MLSRLYTKNLQDSTIYKSKINQKYTINNTRHLKGPQLIHVKHTTSSTTAKHFT